MLHPQSGQAIFVGPHSSGMMDSAGFVAAMFEVIVLPVSAVEKLQDKPIIQYRQYLMCFSAALPCVKGRLWSRWKIVFFFFCLLNDEIGFRVSLYTSCSGISGIIVPLSEGKKNLLFFFFYCHFFLSRLEALVFTWYWKRFPQSEQRERWTVLPQTVEPKAARGFTCARFALCAHFITFANLQPFNFSRLNATANPPATPVTPTHTPPTVSTAGPAFWPSFLSPSTAWQDHQRETVVLFISLQQVSLSAAC